MSAVLSWIKSNIVTVVFLVVMIAAVVALPLLSTRLNANVKRDVDARTGQFGKLEDLTKTQVALPGPDGAIPNRQRLTVNPQLLRRFSEVNEALRVDAQEVLALAREHNQKGRGVLLESLFPAPPPNQAEVLPMQFHRAIMEAHETLLQDLDAGGPPSDEDMLDMIQQRQAKFLTQTLQKDMDDPLSEEEQIQLQRELISGRMQAYAGAADDLRFYASLDVLGLPDWDPTYLPTMFELFEWQWQYWIHEDVLRAMADANQSSSSVLKAPLKHVTGITVLPVEAVAAGGAEDPSREAPLNYAVSFTGRASNPLYDVRTVQFTGIVATNRLTEVLDALARRNFITVLDLQLRPADPFAAAQSGYLYGGEPVSEVVMRLEMIYLRSWTSPFMPAEYREALGLPPIPANQPS